MHGHMNAKKKRMFVLNVTRGGIWLGWTAQVPMDYKAAQKTPLTDLNLYNKKIHTKHCRVSKKLDTNWDQLQSLGILNHTK